jgi:DNA-binding transcriptional regulator YiaG
MPNVAQVLKEEITRLARREVRAVCNPLREQVRSLRETVKKQQEIIRRLEKSLSKMADVSAVTTTSLFAPEEEETRARATPASIRRHRHRLGLSQAALGELLKVSTNSVANWESGASKPRPQHRMALLRLRDLGVRDVASMLEG